MTPASAAPPTRLRRVHLETTDTGTRLSILNAPRRRRCTILTSLHLVHPGWTSTAASSFGQAPVQHHLAESFSPQSPEPDGVLNEAEAMCELVLGAATVTIVTIKRPSSSRQGGPAIPVALVALWRPIVALSFSPSVSTLETCEMYTRKKVSTSP